MRVRIEKKGSRYIALQDMFLGWAPISGKNGVLEFDSKQAAIKKLESMYGETVEVVK